MFNLRNFFVKPQPKSFSSPFTPDWETLEQSPDWLIFEYGEFKRGHKAHPHLNCKPMVHAYTQHKCPLWLWDDHQDNFPIAMNMVPGQPVQKSRIMGEVFQVPTEQIVHLDAYRQNGVQFLRKFVTLILPNQNTIRAQTYVGAKEYWSPKFDWAKSFFRGRESNSISLIQPYISLRHPWLGPYSNYTPHHRGSDKTRCFIGLTNGIKHDRPPEQSGQPTPTVP